MQRVPGYFALIVLWLTASATFAETGDEVSARLNSLEAQVDALTEELERQQLGHVVGRVGPSHAGMGPAASKVYYRDQGVSIGGYGEALYQNGEGEAAAADFLRAVLYFGYKYNEKWVFNSEIELEHASTDKEGSVSVEFAYLDYLARPELNLRAGLVLGPMGLVNELHEPITFLPVNRPETERRIIPSTWRENGAGLYGALGEVWSYKLYVVNGLRGEGFDASGLRGGRQKGSQALAEDLAGVLQVDLMPREGVTVGVSGYAGQSGQDLDVDATTFIGDVHADATWRGFRLRALAALAEVDDAAALTALSADPEEDLPSTGVGERLFGWYVEGGYDLLARSDTGEMRLSPYIRYEQIDTQDRVAEGLTADPAQAQDILTLGIAFQPLDEIIFKTDYEFVDDDAGTGRNRFNLGLGYVF